MATHKFYDIMVDWKSILDRLDSDLHRSDRGHPPWSGKANFKLGKVLVEVFGEGLGTLDSVSEIAMCINV